MTNNCPTCSGESWIYDPELRNCPDCNGTGKTKEELCQHKWLPNGTATRQTFHWSGIPNGEIVVSSAVCEKCGEIRMEKL